MEALVRCVQCQVWIQESESRPMNQLGEQLWTNEWPEDWSRCMDENACVRRRNDLVATPVPYQRPGKRPS